MFAMIPTVYFDERVSIKGQKTTLRETRVVWPSVFISFAPFF